MSGIFYSYPSLNVEYVENLLRKDQLNLPGFFHKIRTRTLKHKYGTGFPAFRHSLNVLNVSFIFIEY